MCDCKITQPVLTEDKVTICAPPRPDMNPIIPTSCLTKEALLRIVDSWNAEQKNDKINVKKYKTANELYSIVEKKMKDLYGCTSEDCWVESLNHPLGAREKLLSLFKPEYPNNFQKNPHDWWYAS